MSGDETPPCNPTEIAAALCASQRREERLCVTDHVNEYTCWIGGVGSAILMDAKGFMPSVNML
ncbi:MAG: hypothetical protein KAT75_04000 [Dehalococcoidia bacterium]|nr:hypothetical protein [Dehalococcoidia bacterium]